MNGWTSERIYCKVELDGGDGDCMEINGKKEKQINAALSWPTRGRKEGGKEGQKRPAILLKFGFFFGLDVNVLDSRSEAEEKWSKRVR